jgi:hypothetical protein
MSQLRIQPSEGVLAISPWAVAMRIAAATRTATQGSSHSGTKIQTVIAPKTLLGPLTNPLKSASTRAKSTPTTSAWECS